MNKNSTLNLLLVAITAIAVATAGCEYPISLKLLKFYFHGIPLHGYIAATFMSLILAFQPHFIGKLVSDNHKKFAGGLGVLSCGLFALLTTAQLDAGYGLFPMFLVMILFSVNTILSLYYHKLKIKFYPDLLRQSVAKLKVRHFRLGKRLYVAKQAAQEEAEGTIRGIVTSTASKILSLTRKRDAQIRQRDQVVNQLNALLNSIDSDIDGAFHTPDN